MKTRFDDKKHWITATGELIRLCDMETSHLLNTVKMLLQKPTRTQAMLITDIEHSDIGNRVWMPSPQDPRMASIQNVTSLTADELVDYVKSTPLFSAMLSELESRGVNTDNTIILFETTGPLR